MEEYLYHEDYGHRELLAQAYRNSIKSLLSAGKKVILVYPVPEAGWNVPDYLVRYYWATLDSAFHHSVASTSYEVYKRRNQNTIDALDKIGIHKNLIRIYPDELFCNREISGRCITQKDDVIFYLDDNHLSNAGARIVIDHIVDHL